ncbi:MAG: hypothetical protein FWE13_04565 [Firmicutes bacterium]|nr:hypothetical protein [Bacillota bacterium]
MKKNKMKKKIYLLVTILAIVAIFVASVVIFGCSSDTCCHDHEVSPPPSISPPNRPPNQPDDLDYFIPITSASELNAIASNLSGDFKLMANITLTNHTPIGNSENPFTGRFFVPSGDNDTPLYRITSLSITNTMRSGGSYIAGLFGTNYGIISNLWIDNFTVNIDNPNPDQNRVLVGAITADNRGIIEFVNVASSTVNVTAHNGGIRAGVIAGRNRGEGGIIRYTVANGTVTIQSAVNRTSRAGGLVGHLEDGGTIYRSGAAVSVSATSTNNVNIAAAGLVGYIQRGATIRESFATGNAFSTSNNGGTIYSGGLTGNISLVDNAEAEDRDEGYRWNVLIQQSFATGNATAVATGGAYASGLIARIDDNAGTPSDVLVTETFSTGNATITPQGAMGNPNHFVGGLVGRIQTLEDSVIRLENSFTKGNITGSGVGNSNFAGALVARFQNNGFRQVYNLFYSSDITVMGNVRPDDGIPSLTNSVDFPSTEVTPANILNSTWQQTNLNFNNTVWAFTNGQLPNLSWRV